MHFETRMDSLIIEKNKITGIETNTGKTFKGPVILATGHSARDVYQWLYDNGVEMEAKGIAVGVRLEHPSMLIDQIQYHNKNGRGKYLPAAEYSFVTQAEGRGVYSFCMCPGGFVVPAASGPHQIVVNGMKMAWKRLLNFLSRTRRKRNSRRAARLFGKTSKKPNPFGKKPNEGNEKSCHQKKVTAFSCL